MPTDTHQPEDCETVSAAELRRNFGVWQARAFAAPVVVARHGKPRLVLSSAERFFAPPSPEMTAGSSSLIEGAVAAIPEHSSEAFLVLDHHLRILAVNRVFEDLSGRSASTMIGRHWPELFPEAGQSIVAAHFRHTLRTGSAAQFETPSLIVEGRNYAFNVFPHQHGVAALIVNRTAEVALREQMEEYRSLVASFGVVPDAGYLRISPLGFIQSGSPQFCRLVAFDAAQDRRVRFTDVLTPACADDALACLEMVLAGGEPVRFDVALRAVSGEDVAASLSLAPIWRGPVASGAMGFFHLTER
jgi:PAS domain S-box-containing protein